MAGLVPIRRNLQPSCRCSAKIGQTIIHLPVSSARFTRLHLVANVINTTTMKEIPTTNKREIASELALHLKKYIDHINHVNDIVRTMGNCQHEQSKCCMVCDKQSECGLHRTWEHNRHKTHLIESELCLFMHTHAWFFLHVLEARAVEASGLLDILVKEQIDALGYTPADTKEYLQEIGYNSSCIK